MSEAAQLAADVFGVAGAASPLPGEIDINYKITVSENEAYILKISRPGADVDYLEFQQKIIAYAGRHGKDLNIPRNIPSLKGPELLPHTDAHGRLRYLRLVSWIPGRPWHRVNPQLDALRHDLGVQCGKLTKALQGFTHPRAEREFPWDIAQGLWTREYLHLFEDDRKELISHYQQQFASLQPAYSRLRRAVVHNDANDHNILVSDDLVRPKVNAVIDYGDALYTQVINDLAVACAYAVMGQPDPLQAALPVIKGYHAAFPLEERELDHLYPAIAMRLVISVSKSAINREAEPGNTYLLVSEQPAWEVLRKWRDVHPDFARFAFRHACGYDPHPDASAFEAWAKGHSFSLAQVFPTIARTDTFPLDLSVGSLFAGHEQEFNNLDLFQFRIEALQKQHPHKIPAGGYLEARPLYTSGEYGKTGNNGPESRTIHLGVDFWLPQSTPVHTMLDGEVVIAVNDAGDKEYGGLVVLKHREGSLTFFSLYGHLSVSSATAHRPGDFLKAGDCVGQLGNYPENGNWAPHLHFQLMLSLFDYQADYPGVAYHSQARVWKGICPDPNLLFKLPALHPNTPQDNENLLSFRKEHLGKSLSLQYKTPIKIVRGSGAYLIDENGRKYLDTVNNVAHVGHEHPAVVLAGQRQMAVLNTNTRYLHDNIRQLAEALLQTLPPELSVLHFVNSGSEANELAIRMVKAATGQRDFIASEVGYHGNTTMCVDISSYKFDGKGGQGAPEHTHIFPLPDAFRGKYRGRNAGPKYAGEVQNQLGRIHKKGRGVGGLIVESIISCGGQIELPEGFLPQAYAHVRAAGGLCIADEVQVGCGRVGKAFWGFQLHGVVPDIVTIGKPLGNGHPLAAVACTKEVAEKFANGMEYFNTFGGNPVSCAIGTAVLQTVKREKLQENALKTGDYLKKGLKELSKTHPIIGDVRGQGLFLGIELVNDSLQPLGRHASYLANRMKAYGILMSTDGPDHNVLKIKPPMVFNPKHAEVLLGYLAKVLGEDFMKAY